MKKKRFIISGLILVLALGGLIYALLESSDYYVTVGELLADQEDNYGESMRVRGAVVEGSIQWMPQGKELRFAIADDPVAPDRQLSLPVLYIGDVHDDLVGGKELTVRGKYYPDGVFHADKLIMKCPSKYEPAD